MAAKSNKTLLIAVVVIVVIIIVCAAAYVLLKNNNNDNNNNGTEYWFYMDYGANNADNGWVSADSTTTPLDALFSALDSDGITYDIGSDGWITSINNIEPDWNATGESWYTWGWSEDSGWTSLDVTLADATGTVYYLGLSTFDSDYNALFTPTVQDGGPFA